MTLTRTLAATAAATTLALAPLAPALAQDGATGDAAPGMAAPDAGSGSAAESDMAVPDALLDTFVTAALSVSSVAEDYQGRIRSAEDDEARDELATEAREAMIAAVEETDGITVEEYVTIAEAAQTDQELNQRVTDLLAERSGADEGADPGADAGAE